LHGGRDRLGAFINGFLFVVVVVVLLAFDLLLLPKFIEETNGARHTCGVPYR
jgi:hypothetical protein